MDLTEINNYADQILEELKTTENASQVRDLVFRLDGLYRGVQIKATAGSAGFCPEHFPGTPSIPCELLAGHTGQHQKMNNEDGMGTARWDGEVGLHIKNEPTKPITDRLHELVSYLTDQAGIAKGNKLIDAMRVDRYDGVSLAYTDAAEKLEALLMEGGI